MKWKPCTVEGCLRRAQIRGLCDAHYGRLKKSGSLKPEVPILSMKYKKARNAIGMIFKGKRNLGS